MKSNLHGVFKTNSAAQPPAILVAAARAKGVFSSAPALAPSRVLRTILFFLLLLAPVPNRANPRALRLTFRNVQSMILIEGKIDDRHVTFLLDTGSNRTIVDMRSYGGVPFLLLPAQRNGRAPGVAGDSVRLPVNLTLADHIWVGQLVSLMNLDELQRVLGIPFDGLLGQDILREFRSVRIDYNDHIVELRH
jgi:hypothetical protein